MRQAWSRAVATTFSPARSQTSEAKRNGANARRSRICELAGRLYIPKLYNIAADRPPVVELLESGIAESGRRVVYSSFRDQRVAQIYIGVDGVGAHRNSPTRGQPSAIRK
jgi:hypothetical protein